MYTKVLSPGELIALITSATINRLPQSPGPQTYFREVITSKFLDLALYMPPLFGYNHTLDEWF